MDNSGWMYPYSDFKNNFGSGATCGEDRKTKATSTHPFTHSSNSPMDFPLLF